MSNVDTDVKRLIESWHVDNCPCCGKIVRITGQTTDGRVIASCFDAFSLFSWYGVTI